MKPTMFAAASVCSRKIENGTSGSFTRRSQAMKREEEHCGRDEDADRLPRVPAPAVALRDAEHEQREAGRDEHRTRDVEALAVLVEALGEEERAQDQRRDADRDVDEEDPLPREEVGEDAAEEHAGGGADATDRTPAAQGDVALTAFLEGRDEDRQRRGRDRRGAEPLERAEARSSDASLHASPQRSEPSVKMTRSDDEDAPASEQVGRAPAEQQEAAEDERVGADDPLEVLLREPEVELDRRQRDVDDRDVEDGHELHREDERECKPLLSSLSTTGVPPVSSFRRVDERDRYRNRLAFRK